MYLAYTCNWREGARYNVCLDIDPEEIFRPCMPNMQLQLLFCSSILVLAGPHPIIFILAQTDVIEPIV